jgi:hypothetical protein
MARRVAFAALLAAWTAAGPASAAEQWVVIGSTVPSVTVGGTLDQETKLVVPADGKVVLLDAEGASRVISGPFEGEVGPSAHAASDGRVLTAIASLVRAGTQTDGSLGAVRAVPAASLPTSLADVEAIDPTSAGIHCVYRLDGQMARRGPGPKPPPTEVTALATGASAIIAWPGDKHRVPWPGTVPLSDGGRYRFSRLDLRETPEMTLKLLPAKAGDDFGRVLELADAGCAEQARLLIGVMARTAAVPPAVPASASAPAP